MASGTGLGIVSQLALNVFRVPLAAERWFQRLRVDVLIDFALFSRSSRWLRNVRPSFAQSPAPTRRASASLRPLERLPVRHVLRCPRRRPATQHNPSGPACATASANSPDLRSGP